MATLGDYISIKHGYAFKGDGITTEDNGVVLVTPGNFAIGGGFKEGKCKFFTDDYPSEFVLSPDDLIVTMTDLSKEMDTLGYSALIPETNRVYLHNQRIGLISINRDDLDKHYLYWFMRTRNYQRTIAGGASGTTVHHTSPGRICEVEVDFPVISTQKKIADILDNIEEKIQNNNDINDNLAAQIETFLLAYLDSEGALPVKLGDYLYIKGRIGWKGLKKSEYLPQSEYRIINGETLTRSGIDWNKAGYISEERYIESPEIMLKLGDILLSKDGTIGKIGYVDSLELPTSVASGIFVIRNTKPDIISTTFIYYLLKSRLFTSFIAARTEGSVIPHLYQKDFMEFEFPLPTAEKMAEFEDVAEPMFSQIVNNLNENKRLAALRDNLLPKLMSGELDVSELDL